MTRNKIFVVILTILLLGIILVSCSNNSLTQHPSFDDPIVYYIDNKNMDLAGIDCNVSVSESNLNNYNLSIRLQLTNTNYDEVYFSISDCYIVNNKTHVNYDVSYYDYNVKLQYGIKKSMTISCDIPTSYKTENYTLHFKNNNNNYWINLYDTPEELLRDYYILYNIATFYSPSGDTYNKVNTQTVKYGKTPDSYIWEDSNHIYYNDTWYTDSERKNTFNKNTKIYEDVTLYGMRKFNINSYIDTGEKWINGINHCPADGILVVDNYNGNVFISNYAIRNNSTVNTLYLPKTLKKIYNGNFENMPSLRVIHFAGTQTEWDNVLSISTSTIPSTVRVIFNSSY